MTASRFDKGNLIIYITGFLCMVTYMVSVIIWGI